MVKSVNRIRIIVVMSLSGNFLWINYSRVPDSFKNIITNHINCIGEKNAWELSSFTLRQIVWNASTLDAIYSYGPAHHKHNYIFRRPPCSLWFSQLCWPRKLRGIISLLPLQHRRQPSKFNIRCDVQSLIRQTNYFLRRKCIQLADKVTS